MRRRSSVGHWVAVITLPFLLAAITITVLVSPLYPRFEYAKRAFPSDLAGISPLRVEELARAYDISPEQVPWSDEQRLELALVAVDYLQRWDSAANTIYLLEEQRIPFSEASLYNQREIDHMVDVKVLTDAIRWGGIGLAFLFGAGLIAAVSGGRRSERQRVLGKTVWRGGLLTILILSSIAILVLAAWDAFFVGFHELLFPPESWTFLYTDSLIRLFPEKFWFDFGVLAVGAILVEGVLAAVVGRRLLRRPPPVTLKETAIRPNADRDASA